MAIPGLAQAVETPESMERAEREVERLKQSLKEKVRSEVKDIGTLRKEMVVTVPVEVIGEHFSHNYDEIRGDVALPGFRKGRAPKKLIRRRFSSDVRNSLKTSIIGQSFLSAVENNSLQVLGDPLFRITKDDQVKLVEFAEAFAAFDLPEDKDFAYTCEFEIKPTFELPELKGIEIKSPQVTIDAETVAAHIERQTKIRGRFEPVTDGGAAVEDDMLIADVALKSEGQDVKSEANVQLGIRPTRLDGIPLMNLGEVMAGVKVGDSRSCECTFPDDYERIDLRGKPGTFEFKVNEIKRLIPITAEQYREQMGAADEAELDKFVMEELEAERDRLVVQAKKQQVLDYLLSKVELTLPERLSARHTDRAVMRRVIEMQQSGVPAGDIERQIDELRTGAAAEVARSLKLEFILEKVAEKLEVGVTIEEVNTEVARIARIYNQRFDRVRDDLHARGLLPQLAEQIRQDKCLSIILRDAKITEVAAEAKPAKTRKSKKKAE
ncbi:MAG: trigger factor [Planctomycetes bacterium]|nr:trigger factor [Planctomycetota bacterium]